MAFGSAYCQLLLRLAYGERWAATGAPAALAAYCPYILLLAINGILEAFVHAVATPRELTAGALLCPAVGFKVRPTTQKRSWSWLQLDLIGELFAAMLSEVHTAISHVRSRGLVCCSKCGAGGNRRSHAHA